MPDFKIPKLNLATGNSSETDLGSTARSSGSANANCVPGTSGNKPESHLINKKPRKIFGRRNQRKTASLTNAPQRNGSESDANSISSIVEPTLPKSGPVKNRKFFVRGNQKKQTSITTLPSNRCNESGATTSARYLNKKPNQLAAGPIKKIRKSVGGGPCAKKPQPLNLQSKDANISIAAVKPKTNLPIANVPKTKFSPNATVTEAGLPIATVTEANLPIATVTELSLPIATVTEANLPIATVTEASLSIAAVTEANLPIATVTEASLPIATVPESYLAETGTIFLQEVNVPEVNLSIVTESETDLSLVAESEINFEREPLPKTNLTEKLPIEIDVPEDNLEGEQILQHPIEATIPKTPTKSFPTETPKSLKSRKTALVPFRIGCASIEQQYRESILKFQSLKSVSQMDFKHARRSASYQLVRASGCANHVDKYSSSSSATITTDNSSDDIVLNDEEKSYQRKLYYVIHEQNPRFAGMRVLLMIMLNAWRKRRSEAKHLCALIEDLKHSSVKAKNQLHVFNSLFRVEKKRNEDLTLQLQRSNTEVNKWKVNCDELSVSINKLKHDLVNLQKHIRTKDQDYEELNAILDETKSELFKAMSLQREKQTELSNEQRRVQELENENTELLYEMNELQIETKIKEIELTSKIEIQNSELLDAQNRIKFFENEYEGFKLQELKLKESIDSEAKLKEQTTNLENELKTLRKYVDATLSKRCKNFWKSTKDVPRGTILWLHWMAFYMLPATPAPAQSLPSLPFGLTLEKALSIIKR